MWRNAAEPGGGGAVAEALDRRMRILEVRQADVFDKAASGAKSSPNGISRLARMLATIRTVSIPTTEGAFVDERDLFEVDGTAHGNRPQGFEPDPVSHHQHFLAHRADAQGDRIWFKTLGSV